MKKTIKLAVVAALALGTTSAFATNGAELIGMGAKTRGMAGTGIGMSHGAESALINPALITSVKGTEVSFGGTIFMPKVKTGTGSGNTESSADLNLIPEVSLATKVNDNFYWGVGMWGTGGMGVDYRYNPNQYRMVTNLQIMQFGVPLAYTTNGFTAAVTPIMQYGSLDMNYFNGANYIGNGVSQDLKTGYNLGVSYETAGLTIGAVYKSRIDMNYKGQISTAMLGFGQVGYSDLLSTPAEAGAGVSYAMDGSTFAIDFKQIKWSEARGYEDFGWKDQNVVSIGYEYAAEGWAARVGYSHTKSPIENQTAANSLGTPGALLNTLNNLGFPAIVESHFAIGGTYSFNQATSLDVAYVYAPEKSLTMDNFGGGQITTKHHQSGISAQLNFTF